MAETPQTIIAALAAAFPSAKIGADHLRMYVRALADIPADELQQAALAYAVDGRFFPSIRELRRTVMEARTGLPTADEAWEQATRWAERAIRTGRTIRCPNPDCAAGVVAGGKPVQLDRTALEIISNPAIRAAMERIADAAAQPTSLCPTCEGEAEIPNPALAELAADRPHPAVMAALDHVGGPHGIVETDVPEVVRSQFLKAYGRRRDEEVRHASLESAGLGQLSGAMRAELPRGEV